MAEVYTELDLKGLRRLFPERAVKAELEDDLFLVRMNCTEETELTDHPLRVDAYLVILCYGGQIEIEINRHVHVLDACSMLIYTPLNVMRMRKVVPEPGKPVRFAVAAIATDLLTGSRMNFNRIYQESLRFMENPAIMLRDDEMDVCRRYFELVVNVSRRTLPDIRESVIMLIASSFFWAGSLWQDRVTEARRHARGSFRAREVFEDFLRLAQDYHMTERSLGFYADKLYMSPKYLSKMVKTVSGRSAHEWIDALVVREAQNMLRYSDLPVKEIVTRLNFPNQTTFYRFFKIQTGQTPTEYRKG